MENEKSALKVVSMQGVELVSENEFTKVFKVNDMDLFVSKAFDAETDKHYLVNGIPVIPELNVSEIQYPILFETEELRDEAFSEVNIHYAKAFVRDLVLGIKLRNEQNKIDKPEIE